MDSSQDPIVKDLVLIGGGHSHVSVLKSFGMNPVQGVRVSVIARDVQTPYSGMLPGYVAGHYSFDHAHVDLRPLSIFSKARLFHDEAIGINLSNKQVICKNRPPVSYDILSINIGSSPNLLDIKGASKYTTPVKPINCFVDKWNVLLERVLKNSGPHRIGVVGGGAGGIEILLAIHFRLTKVLRELGRGSEELSLFLISRSVRIMPKFPKKVATIFTRILLQRNVSIYLGVEAEKVDKTILSLSDGTKILFDEILWVTDACAPNWLKTSGLDVNQHGFIEVFDTLQSCSDSDVFAAGDIASVKNFPRPKSGVFAVRQGRPLSDNLRRILLKRKLKSFKPQKTTLALISSGNQYAIATKGRLVFEGKLLWRLKDWIDNRWVKKYTELPEMKISSGPILDKRLADKETIKEISAIAMRCGGCGAKVGSNILTNALSNLKPVKRNDVIIGLHEPDDAAVLDVGSSKLMVHTVDYFKSFIDDPYIFGQIAAYHSLSDLFAMGAEAQSALAIATIPFGIETKVEDTINQLMAGALLVLNASNTALVGGHTSEGAELAVGFSVNGLIDKEKILRKGGMNPGDQLILTKGLGTGTIFAADMQQKARGRWVESAIQSMLSSNRVAAEIIFNHDATACTDITGFGLLGHMVEMIKASEVDVEIFLSSIPIINGALDTMAMGIFSSLQPANIRLRRAILNLNQVVESPIFPLIFDPQTSGGLLASIPEATAQNCLKGLKGKGYVHSAIIGTVVEKSENLEPIILRL